METTETTGGEYEVLTIAEAAAWAKVSEDVIRSWIVRGMRATPTGSIGKRGPRNYLIFRCWLIAWMVELAERERRRLTAVRHQNEAAQAPRLPPRRLMANRDSPLGPPPKTRR